MGCSSSVSSHEPAGDYPEKSIKAALLIQAWYRRYLARLEAKRKYTWSIFQSLEYSGEQDQLRLYNFFNDMMTQLELASATGSENSSRRDVISAMTLMRKKRQHGSIEEMDAELWEETNPDVIGVSDSYRGPHISFPLTTKQLQSLTDAFKDKQILHAKYVLQILHETRQVLRLQPNVTTISVKEKAKQLTVVGDLHGKLDDLLMIFYKNGLPDRNNPYLFNGDFVDRGPHSVEICVLIFAYNLLFPGSVYVNRGNHEDHVMNLRYGFVKEIIQKYKHHSSKMLNLFEDVFSWLPLASVIDKTILVTHGGISDKTSLNLLAKIDRHSYHSILRPPKNADGETVDALEWRQLLDILWSDPRASCGCAPNDFRGGGVYWGPDITRKMLDKHGLKMLIRSHECKEEGYEYAHNGQVLTIFSASNYYEVGSNKGAYIKLGPDLKPRIIQFISSKYAQHQISTSKQLNIVEESALRGLREKIVANTADLLKHFQKFDTETTGYILIQQWSSCMTEVLGMDLPWRKLRTKLVKVNSAGLVEYKSTFECHVENKIKNRSSGGGLTETLYKNKDSLETIFRAIDTDNSGNISVAEFEEACTLLSQHTQTHFSVSEIEQMARNIDQNNDGYIDFNEFLEAFRIVDQFGREMERRKSLEMDAVTAETTAKT